MSKNKKKYNITQYLFRHLKNHDKFSTFPNILYETTDGKTLIECFKNYHAIYYNSKSRKRQKYDPIRYAIDIYQFNINNFFDLFIPSYYMSKEWIKINEEWKLICNQCDNFKKQPIIPLKSNISMTHLLYNRIKKSFAHPSSVTDVWITISIIIAVDILIVNIMRFLLHGF